MLTAILSVRSTGSTIPFLRGNGTFMIHDGPKVVVLVVVVSVSEFS